LLEPEADCAAEKFLEEIALSADAVVIMHVLRDAVRSGGLYEGVGDNRIARIEGSDVCVARNSFLIPRPVDENRDPFHGKSRSLSQPQMKAGPQSALRASLER
jgi:hypothetical protein